MIVDAHVHVFSEITGLGASETFGPVYDDAGRLLKLRRSRTGHVPGPGDPHDERFKYTPEMLIANMDSAGVAKAVLLQGPFYGDQNSYVLDAVQRCPERLIGAAYLDPWNGDARAEFEKIRASRQFRALKLEFSESYGLCRLHPGARLDAPYVAWLWPELAKAGMALVLDLGAIGTTSYQTAAVRKIAEAQPGLRIVLCHLGQPTPAVTCNIGVRRAWEQQIMLGTLPNVWFDCASLPSLFVEEGFPYPGVERHLRMAVDAIGPRKITWGSDIPTNLDLATYPEFVEMARLHTRFLTLSEQELILSANALQVYGW